MDNMINRTLYGVLTMLFVLLHQDALSDTDARVADVYAKVKDKIILVQCVDSAGSGFILEMENGKKYFITNKHVVEGQQRVAAILLNRKELPLGAFEVAKDRDLVRFALASNAPDGLTAFDGEPNLGERVFIFGNSDGAGVATGLKGDILGVGPSKIEVSAQFVPGNSGSAVLNGKGEVVGVATFLTRDADPNDWTKSGTRFQDVRRWALRLDGIEWEPMKFQDFYKRSVAAIEKSRKERNIYPEISARFTSPKMRLVKMAGVGSAGIEANIVLSLYSMPNTFKNPVVRVCMLIKSKRGYRVKYCIFDEAQGEDCNSVRMIKSPPVYGYGENSRGTWRITNNSYVYYLEGYSYYQGDYPDRASKKGIKYFCGRSVGRWGGGGRFRVMKDDEDIVCFRLECWQNGSLAAVYNSRPPLDLIAKRLPVDWFIYDKYSNRFDYSDRELW